MVFILKDLNYRELVVYKCPIKMVRDREKEVGCGNTVTEDLNLVIKEEIAKACSFQRTFS